MYEPIYDKQVFKIPDIEKDADGFELVNTNVPMIKDDYLSISAEISVLEEEIEKLNEQRKLLPAKIKAARVHEMELIRQLKNNQVRKDLYCKWIFNFDTGLKKLCCKINDEIVDVMETYISQEERQMNLFNQ